jgi:hypothetical protein
MVILANCTPIVLSSYTEIQILVSNYCPSITDIRLCKDIPYLQLRYLLEVKDFSSLGNQRYLMLEVVHVLPIKL